MPKILVAPRPLIVLFDEVDVTKLFAQRTAENGQQITQEALDYVYEQSQGQPWIVNQSRETHLDELAERLKEPRIRGVVQPILVGETGAILDPNHRDVMLTMDLGLIKWDEVLLNDVKHAPAWIKKILITLIDKIS